MNNGIIVIDKPEGWTSMDVCAKLRTLMGERRVGHSGTLDPMATGVLPVFVGRATRAVEFAVEGDKEYLAGLRFGISTDTQDTTGTVREESPIRPTLDELTAVLPQFTGKISQLPPMYSAIKINGQKLYELARKGQEVERQPRPITIHSLTIERQNEEGDYLLRVRCSKGTYIRTLCHDIGALLGCGGVMSSLCRTMAAEFTLDEAISMDTLLKDENPQRHLVGVDRCFSKYPAITCTDLERDKYLRNGTPYRTTAPDGNYRVYDESGKFLMYGESEYQLMTAIKSFFEV